MTSVTIVPAQELRRFAEEAFRACGAPEATARTAAEVLCYADENGFDTHGVANLERIYVARMLDGRIDPQAEFELTAETASIAALDARGGLGLAVGARAMELAIDKAAQTGIGCVAVRRSSHFGSAGYYTQQAVRRGMIGIAMTNLGSQAIARPPGGSAAMLGTNPIAMGAPGEGHPPFQLDMSTTVVATGKIKAALRRGEPIPEGWLVDGEGRPVTDPAAYEEGWGHLQMLGGDLSTGGAKGFGLALLVDILCGALSGAEMGPHERLLSPEGRAAGAEDVGVGHFFLAIDPARFRPDGGFERDMGGMLGALLACPPAREGGRVVYPGYLEAARARREQVELDETLAAQLFELAGRLGLAPLRERAGAERA
ncbi:Ldh family oxidoreductase [Paenibacillus albicereus]|uniref:Ldh family oxidoreductase n=1 Tax=Paenibacillus albicereus TaxID=2726185 RepID=A0A6H2GV52_9BACL|nr:Ldh family oxidoreductase [Paenibacillus albicereus]QJC51028.1 Ldh family oxidoreductase [Paenibacillus albicereus]